MNHPLDGARLKVVRAQEHLDSFKAEVRMYLDEQPKEVRSERKDQAYEWIPVENHFLPAVTLADPPLRLSSIIGDCVTNARAALDYVVWQLAVRYFVPPLTIKDRKWVSWPICEHRVDFTGKIEGFSKRLVPASALAEIDRTHHENAGYESLNWLRLLVNEDKHRMPLLTVGDFDYLAVTFETPAIFQDISTTHTHKIPRHRATEGNPQPGINSNVEMKAEVPAYVAFQDVAMPREPVERTLAQILKTLTDVIPRFDGFF